MYSGLYLREDFRFCQLLQVLSTDSLQWPIHIINSVDKTKLSCITGNRFLSIGQYPGMHEDVAQFTEIELPCTVSWPTKFRFSLISCCIITVIRICQSINQSLFARSIGHQRCLRCVLDQGVYKFPDSLPSTRKYFVEGFTK